MGGGVRLRPYQHDSIDRTRAALGRVRSVLLQAPTGAGKTAMAAAMCARGAERERTIYFACHRAELLLQTAGAFNNEGIPHGFIAPGWPKRPQLPVQICSIQTLSRRLDTIADPDLLIIDECVPPGTMIATPIGDQRIEDLQVGDLVHGSTEGVVVATRIKHVFKRPRRSPFVRVNDLVLTSNHPVWTDRGWVQAGEVKDADQVGEWRSDGRVQVHRVRMRRALPQNEKGQGERCAPGRTAPRSGLGSPEVLEQGHPRIDAAGSGGDPVFNIETDTGDYFANGLLVHNCHHVAAKSWARVVERWPRAFIVGLSATPQRLDGKGLGDWFDELVLGPSVAELIEDGYLSRYRLFAPSTPELAGVKTLAGDYQKRQLGQAVNRPRLVGDIVTHWQRLAPGLRTIVFCVSIEHSEATAQAFRQAGVPAAHIDGKTAAPIRAAKLRQLASWRIQVVTNVELFGEGFDLSANAGTDCTVECVVSARPTQSLSIWLQQVGRALRPKPDPAIILDHAGNAMRHGLPDDDREWSLTSSRTKSRDRVAPVRQCPRCFSVHSPAYSKCPECQWLYPVQAREVKQVAGDLEEVDIVKVRRKRKRENRAAKTREDLITLGESRGYKYPDRWANHELARRDAWKDRSERRTASG